MSESTVAIVGSGMAGAAVAYQLVQQGVDVALFEKGPEYPFPYTTQFQEEILNHYINPARDLAPELRPMQQTGDLPFSADSERRMRVGGMATSWQAIALRMLPDDFRTQSRFGRGQDWPISYAELEPYYSRAEAYLGVSGTDADNPFAPPRLQPHPLPPFELSYVDQMMADRLRSAGIHIHTTPQARIRSAYENRATCQNFGACGVCPMGARYSPAYHLQLIQPNPLFQLHTQTAVRRVILDGDRASGLLIRDVASGTEYEHHAQVIVLAPGAIETVRLLRLSADDRHRDGLGNDGGQVGQRLNFHQIRYGLLRYTEKVFPGRAGPPTGQSHQFINHDERGAYGGVKVELTDTVPRSGIADASFAALNDLETAADFFLHTRWLWLHNESDMTTEKYVALSDQVDTYGDRIPHLHHQSSAFDEATYAFSQQIFEQIAAGTEAESSHYSAFDNWVSWSHHLGGARMSHNPAEGVVNAYSQVHGIDNLFTAGASSFVEAAAVNPTLTIVALALRTTDYILDQRLH